MKVHTLTLFILLFGILLLTPSFASSTPTSHYSATIHVKASQYGYPWDIHLSMDVTDINQVAMNGQYAKMYAQFSVGDIPTYVWKNGVPGYILKSAFAELKLGGTNAYQVESDSKNKPSDGWGDVATIGLSSTQHLVEENRDGVYFWDLHIKLYYEHLVSGVVTDTYTIEYNLIPDFQDFTIVSFSTGGDWISEASRGVVKAFSQIWNIWTATGQKINFLNWNIDITDGSFGVLSVFTNLEKLLLYIASALFNTFVVPITTISLIMGYLNNAMVISFFVISLVITAIIAITIFTVLWKIIILVKP